MLGRKRREAELDKLKQEALAAGMPLGEWLYTADYYRWDVKQIRASLERQGWLRETTTEDSG